MSLSDRALITLNQAKNFIRLDAAASLHVDAEYLGMGDGGDKTFDLDHTPIDGTLKLYVNGTLQVETTGYSISTATITFVSAPALNHPITASYDYAASTDTFESYDDDLLERLIEAATKKAEDYTARAFVNDTITETHHGEGTGIIRLYRQPVNSITSVSWQKAERFTGDGDTVDFALNETPLSGSLSVYVDGTLQTATTDYTLSGATITFTTAPSDEAKIVAKYYVELDVVDDYTEWLHIGRLKGSWLNNYIYRVVYSAGYGANRATVQPLLPDAVTAVLIAVATWYENRLGVKSQSITGIGSVDYGDPEDLPAAAKAKLRLLKLDVL
jgi:hypothetical protein